MSGILNRTVRMEKRNDRATYRPADWNIVNTSIGPCWEPRYFDLGLRDTSLAVDTDQEVDQTDNINRVDMVTFDWDARDPFHRDPMTKKPLIGGNLRYWLRHDYN